jgi:hypothetical protein
MIVNMRRCDHRGRTRAARKPSRHEERRTLRLLAFSKNASHVRHGQRKPRFHTLSFCSAMIFGLPFQHGFAVISALAGPITTIDQTDDDDDKRGVFVSCTTQPSMNASLERQLVFQSKRYDKGDSITQQVMSTLLRRGASRRRWSLGCILLAALATYLVLWTATSQVHHRAISPTNTSLGSLLDSQDKHSLQSRLTLKEEFTRQRIKVSTKRTTNSNEISTVDRSEHEVPKDPARANGIASTPFSSNNSIVEEMTPGRSSIEELFVAYQLHYDQPYNITFGHQTTCKVGITANKWGRKQIKRVPLSPPFQQILGVTTTWATNLKVISVGDSVGMQFHEMLEEAAGISYHTRHVYHNAWGEHESVSISAPTHGGGVLAAFRMTGMLLPSGKGRPPPNAGPQKTDGAGGWLPEHVQQLLMHTYPTGAGGTHRRVESFDAMVYRIPHGWLSLDKVTTESLTRSLLLANELFGVRMVIVLTNHFNNNVITEQDLQDYFETNTMIRKTVHSWRDNVTLSSLIPAVLVMEFGAWTDAINHMNAQLAGYDVSSESHHYLLARLGGSKFPPSLAMACVDKVEPRSSGCTRNMLTIDGMHWCMESLGGRIVGGLTCLLQCTLEVTKEKRNGGAGLLLRQCEERCNGRFMSLSKAGDLSPMYSAAVS